MTQALRTQLAPIASMDGYRWQYNLYQFQSHLSSTRSSAAKRIYLSQQGWQKLIQAGVLNDKFSQRYTDEQLSERSLLDERTVSRLLNCEFKVDKSTLKTFFPPFNLSLEADEYISSQGDGANNCKPDASTHAILTIERVEFEQLVKELYQLKECIREYDRLPHQLGLNENHIIQHSRASIAD